MKRRILTLLLALALVFSLAPAAFAGAETAQLSNQKLSFNGMDFSEVEKYNIDGSNYFKLRDVAALLDGTVAQFNVGYDNASKTVAITTGRAYDYVGTELQFKKDNARSAVVSPQTITVDGKAVTGLTAYNIGGSNFFQLRELGKVLGFEDAIGYDNATRTVTLDVDWKQKVCTEQVTINKNADGTSDYYRYATDYDEYGNNVRELTNVNGYISQITYVYDENGFVIHDESADNGEIYATTDYRYDEYCREIWHYYVNGDYTREYTAAYDGELLTSESYTYGNGEYARLDYYYNESGDVIRKETFDAGGITDVDTYTYTANGSLLTHRYERSETGRWTKVTCTYNAAGYCTSYTWTDSDGANSTDTYRYDNAGNCIYEKIGRSDEGGADTVIERAYDAYGKLIREETTKGEEHYLSTWTYNAAGRCIAETYEGNERKSSVTYEYSADGLLLVETYTNTDPEFGSYRTVYTYDTEGDVTGYVQTWSTGMVSTVTYAYKTLIISAR